jgi:hypothetical protein
MNDATDTLIRQMQDAAASVSDVYRDKVPLSYGCKSGIPFDSMEIDS